MTRHIRKIADLNGVGLSEVLSLAHTFQEQHLAGIRRDNVLDGRVVALVFEKPSLRTKVSFEVAAMYLGGNAVFLSSEQIFSSGGHQTGRESVPDIGRNLERFCDVIIARVFNHSTIETLAGVVKVPIINALCDLHHPCQAVADVMTMETRVAQLKGGSPRSTASNPPRLRVAYVGDGNNVATSLVQACAMRGHDVTVASPAGYDIPEGEWTFARSLRIHPEQELTLTRVPQEAVLNADVVYTDTYVSMGQEAARQQRVIDFTGFQVNRQLMGLARPKAVFMHCLPAHRGEEVTDEVMDSPQSIVFDQAECRLHVAKAVLVWCLGLQPSKST